MVKITREKFKTWGNVFDAFTERNLFKLASEGHFKELKSPISIGKEANIFSAKKEGKDIIVKIYRLETCDFKKMFDYIKYDTRYLNLKKNRRRIIFTWTQREYRNLLKAREIGLNVPTPLTFKENIIVMEMVGDPAPMLKDSPPDDPKKFMDKVVDMIAKLYKAGLVHGDLSPFNILNNNETPFFIDFSQCTPVKSQNATELIERDIKNIIVYAKKEGYQLDEKKVREKIIR